MGKSKTPTWSIRDYGPSHGSHSHDHFQVLWGLDGNLALEIEGKGLEVSAGDGLVIAPSERHDFESLSGSRCLILDSPDIGWSLRDRIPQFTKATDLLARFISEAIEQTLPIDHHHAAMLLAQSWSPTPLTRKARREIDWEKLTRWATSRMPDSITALDLAEQACLSESQFRTRCLEERGCSPMQWLRRLRLEHAKLLRAQGKSMSEIARRTGYESPSALTAALKRQK